MLSFFRSFFGRGPRPGRPTWRRDAGPRGRRAPLTRRTRLHLEALEDRTLLSGGGLPSPLDPAVGPSAVASPSPLTSTSAPQDGAQSGSLAGQSGSVAGQSVQAPLLSTPPQLTPEQLAIRTEHAGEDSDMPAVPVDPNGAPDSAAASAPGQSAGAAQAGSPQAPGDFTFFRNTNLASGTAGSTSDVGEPSVGGTQRTVFQTGNWYASVSGDNGSTFGFVNPYTLFPATGDFSGGFCCDQRVAQVPSLNMVLWYLQYVQSGSTSNDVGGVRIARSLGNTGLLTNSWTYYNFTPESFGQGRGKWLDFPHMEVSSNDLYATSNLYSTVDDSYQGSVLWRIPLAQLQAGGSINYTYWVRTTADNDFSLALTSNATTTMYAGAIESSTSVRVFQQNEGDTTLSWTDVSGLATTYFGTHTTSSPDGNNWTGRADSRIQTAWVANGVIGFMWNSAQGTNRPNPFVRALRVNASDKSLIDQPDLWSNGGTWHYPSLAVDARGHIAGPVWYGDASTAPRVQILIYDDFSPGDPFSVGWENYFALAGTNGANNAWGDYLGSQPHPRFGNTWTATGYVLTGPAAGPGIADANIQAQYFWFGRDRDNPNVLPPLTDVGDTAATAQGTGLTGFGGSYSHVDGIWTPANGMRDVDLYQFRASAGSQFTATTALPTGGDSMDTVLRLFDANGNELALNDDDPLGGTFYSRLTYTFAAAGTYYVGVSGYNNRTYNLFVAGSGTNGVNNDSVGDYQLSVSLSPPSDDGDTLATATDTSATLGPTAGNFRADRLLGNGAFGAKDVDMFRLTVAAGTTLNAFTAFPPGATSTDTILRLFNAGGTQLAFNDDDPLVTGFYSRFSYTFTAAGTYYVGVSGYNNQAYDPTVGGSGVSGSTGDYRLTLSLLSTTSWAPLGPAPIVNGQVPGNGSVSGRITSVAAHPTDPNTIYIGTAGGGVWKTTNGGVSWAQLTDGQITQAIGAVALAPSNPAVVYAGTGEANNSIDSYYGRGLYKSTDGGATWALLGVAQFNRRTISKIVVDPANASVVYVAVAGGGVNGVSGNTGVWKSTDGGTTWTNTTTAISTTAAFSDLVMDPTNAQTLYAAVGTYSGSSANGVYKTTNGGASWSPAGNFPTGAADSNVGRIALAISRTSPQTLYASITATGALGYGLYDILKTINGGSTWSEPYATFPPNYLGGQGWYDTTLIVDPADANVVYAAGAAGTNSVLRSPDGGSTWADVSTGVFGDNGPHADHHGIAFDAGGKLLDGNDGGIWRLDNPLPGSVTWSDLNSNLNTIQFTGIALHPTDSLLVYGGSQDNGTEKYTGAPGWTRIAFGDGGFVRVDPANPNTIYHTYFYTAGFFERSDDGGLTWNTKTTGINTSAPGLPADEDDPARFYPPYIIDPGVGRSNRLLLGTNRVYESNNKGDSWAPISTPFSNGWTTSAVIDALAAAKTDVNTVYATAGGKIFVTTNRGLTWTDVSHPVFTDHFADLLVDPTNSQVVYAVRDRFSGVSGGHVFRSTDGGQNWTDISGSGGGVLPNIPAWSIALDANGPGAADDTLYVGTDKGLYYSTNLGASWAPLGTGLPNVQVVDVETNENLHIVAVGTHGRGVWEIASVPRADAAPTGLALAPASLPENQPAGTAVGTFSTTDPDAADAFTYSLVAGTGSTDNASFTISGNQLLTAAPFNFEAKSSYSIRVRTTDLAGLSFEKVITVTVTNVNEAPTNVSLSGTAAPEFRPVGTLVGSLSTSDPDAGNTFTYSLVAGTGSTDNASFTISGNQLLTADAFDAQAKSSYSVRVRTTDQGNLVYERVFTIAVTNDPAIALSGRTLTLITNGAAFTFAPASPRHSLSANGTDYAVNAAAVDAVVFQGGSADDSLSVDYSGSSAAPALTFNAGGGSNSLTVLGGTFTSVIHNLTGAAAGNLSLANGAGTRTLSYTNTASVLLFPAGEASLGVNLPAGANTASLEDDATAGDGESVLRSLNGSFATTVFTDPDNALTLNFGGGDAVSVNSVDPLFRAALTVSDGGAGGSTVNLNTSLTLGASGVPGNLIVTAAAINLNGPVTSTNGGNQTYQGAVTVGPASLALAAGTVTFTGPLNLGTDTLAVTGNFALTAAATLATQLSGPAAGQYGHVTRTGTVSLGGAALSITRLASFVPADGTLFDLVGLNSGGAISGTFAGLAEGATTAAGTAFFTVSYAGGTQAKDAVLRTILPPVGNPDSYSGLLNAVLVVGGPGVLANDSDPDGGPLSAALLAGPAHGTVTLNADGSFTYVPDYAFAGSDSFTYRVSDPLLSSTATVTLTVARPLQQLFVLGQDNRVYAEKFTIGGSPAGGYFLAAGGTVAAFGQGHDALGRPELFVLGLDNRVYYARFDAAGNPVGGYTLVAGGAVKGFTVGQDALGRPVLFAQGQDNQVYYVKFDLSGIPVGGYTLAAAGSAKSYSAGSDPAYNPELFIQGTDDQVYRLKFDANDTPVGGYTLAAAGTVKGFVVGADGNGNPELFVQGMNDQVYALKFSASNTPVGGYFLVATGTVKSFTVSTDGSGRPELFAQMQDDQVYALKFDVTGSALGGYVLTKPGTIAGLKVSTAGNGNPVVIVLGLDNQLYEQLFDAAGNSIGGYVLVAGGTVKGYSVSK